MDRKTLGEHKEKRLKVGVLFTLVLILALLMPYVLSLEEPARISLLGAALVGVAFWGRRHLARQDNP